MKKFSKSLAILCLSFSSYHVDVAASNYGGENNMEPKVLAQISPSAVDKALSPDGLKAILGIYFGPQKFESMVVTDNKALSQKTSKKMSVFAVSLGVEYAKSFKNSLFVAAQLLVDLGPKKKQSGEWSTINEAFDKSIDPIQYPGERKGQVCTDFFTPSIGLKIGYRFRKFRSNVYLKFAFSRLAGEYRYYLQDEIFGQIKANTVTLSGCLGAEYRMSKKFGVGLEIGAPFQRKSNKKKIKDVEHESKMSRVEVRALVYYTAVGSGSDVSSEYIKE